MTWTLYDLTTQRTKSDFIMVGSIDALIELNRKNEMNEKSFAGEDLHNRPL